MGFSSKVKFIYKGIELIGRICEELENDEVIVVTTGKYGNFYQIKKSLLSLV